MVFLLLRLRKSFKYLKFPSFMSIKQKRSKRGAKRSGRHSDKDLPFICLDSVVSLENLNLDTMIMRGMAILGKIRFNETNKLMPYVSPDYNNGDIAEGLKGLVKEEKLSYRRKSYCFDVV